MLRSPVIARPWRIALVSVLVLVFAGLCRTNCISERRRGGAIESAKPFGTCAQRRRTCPHSRRKPHQPSSRPRHAGSSHTSTIGIFPAGYLNIYFGRVDAGNAHAVALTRYSD